MCVCGGEGVNGKRRGPHRQVLSRPYRAVHQRRGGAERRGGSIVGSDQATEEERPNRRSYMAAEATHASTRGHTESTHVPREGEGRWG